MKPLAARRMVSTGLDDYDLADLALLRERWPSESAAGALRRALNEYADLVRRGALPPRRTASTAAE